MMNDNLDKNNLPDHVAIIMDGNGRWAAKKGLERIFGHNSGVESVQEIVEEALNLEIPYLTLYAFSTDNWSRPQDEIGTLMNLLVKSLKSEFDKLIKNNICLNTIGDLSALPEVVQNEVKRVSEKTKNNNT